MKRQGMGLAGKLVIIFSALYGLLLAGVLVMSANFFIKAKERDAKYRVVDVINTLRIARNQMPDAEFGAYLSEIFSSRFRAAGYDLDLVEITIASADTVLSEKRQTPEGGRRQRYHAEIRNAQAEEAAYTIDLVYSLANLERGIWDFVWRIVVVGAAAFVVGIVLILLFARRSTKPLRTLASAMQEVGKGNLAARVTVKSRDEVGVLGEAFNWMMRGLEEGEFVKRIFKRYVTRQVAEKILSEKEFVNLKGDRREVSILFADIRGFTKFSQHMAPEEIIALLNHYFAPVIDVIIENEGVLDKFMGDGFLAFWNAPLSQKDYALRTCQAALGIQRVIARLNFQRENEGKVQIQMGMGIHTGTAIAGNIGSSRRMEYTIIGESVNFAERLQEAAMQGEILVSVRTRELVGERLMFAQRRLKIEDYGDAEIEVFELLQPKEVKT
ncbi:adenylate/guanylate cyclase domain-containing protein [candidate division WOR-3 bacterium]|nr:adenylate/guanylate cyclase domain-containing protein [candidate division WOR-3 bacterium]